MVKRHLYGNKSILTFEPFASELSQYSQEYNMSINRPLYEPFV